MFLLVPGGTAQGMRFRNVYPEPFLKHGLGFDSDVADAADDVVGGRFALYYGYDFDGISLVLWPQN